VTEEMKADQQWKEQARLEKERLSSQLDDSAKEAAQKLPPADFLTFVSGLAAQCMLYLGVVPNPHTGKTELDLDAAKYHIDLVAVLQEKTQGNLSDEEAGALKSILTDLRMRFVAATNEKTSQAEAETEKAAKPKIVIP
jgi:Domain of unknown function (DUF1844)